MKTIIPLLLSILFSTPVLAQKLNLDVGVYDLQAKSETAEVDLTRPGIYSLNAAFSLKNQFDLGIGYSLFFAKVISGDMGYGPDISLIFYPFGGSLGVYSESQQVKYREVEHNRYFIQGSFHQRQFQSAQSPYSGFGFSFGMESQMTDLMALRSLFRYQTLSGPNDAKLTQTELLFGVQLQFQ